MDGVVFSVKKLPWCPAICSLCLLLLPERASSGMRTSLTFGRKATSWVGADLQWTRLTSAVCWPSRLALVSFRFRSLSPRPPWPPSSHAECTVMLPLHLHATRLWTPEGEEGWLSGLSLLDATPSVTAALPSLCHGR